MLTVGVDIGSTSSKCVLLEDGRKIVAQKVIALGTGTKAPQLVYEEVMKMIGDSYKDIPVLATGYGRTSFEHAKKQLSEVSCHAKGMFFLNPEVRTLIDIGGQDVKAMRIGPTGRLENFVMNEKCAAGTGRFLEVMARVLDISVTDMSELAKRSTKEIAISNTCTVFAESEVISQLSAKVAVEDIVAGILRSVAKRVASLAGRVGIKETVGMSGGVSLNQGIVSALEKELKTPVYVSEYGQIVGAIGAALFAYEDVLKEQKST